MESSCGTKRFQFHSIETLSTLKSYWCLEKSLLPYNYTNYLLHILFYPFQIAHHLRLLIAGCYSNFCHCKLDIFWNTKHWLGLDRHHLVIQYCDLCLAWPLKICSSICNKWTRLGSHGRLKSKWNLSIQMMTRLCLELLNYHESMCKAFVSFLLEETKQNFLSFHIIDHVLRSWLPHDC